MTPTTEFEVEVKPTQKPRAGGVRLISRLLVYNDFVPHHPGQELLDLIKTQVTLPQFGLHAQAGPL